MNHKFDELTKSLAKFVTRRGALKAERSFVQKSAATLVATLAAMIIILLHQEGTFAGTHLWDSALSRIIAVVSGCILGLLVTYVFHSIFKINAPVAVSEAAKKEREG